MKNHNTTFTLELLDVHWLGTGEEEDDRCAHGQVKVQIGSEIVMDQDDENQDWTVSSAALHLLWTLEGNHEPGNLINDHLIPCCGFNIDHLDHEPRVHMQGCFTGYNWWVKHDNDAIILETVNGVIVTIPFDEYKEKVLLFSDKVEQFYNSSKPKNLPEDEYDLIGYQRFLSEWKRSRDKWR